MDCLYTNCNSKTGTDYDRLLICWLCQRLGHPKCAGLTARAADAAVDSSKGLRWSCPECRSRDIDFYRLFGQTKVRNERKNWRAWQRNLPRKWLSASIRSVANGPSSTSSVYILIPDAVSSTAPVMTNSPEASADLVDLSSPNPLSSEKDASLPVQIDQTVPLDDRSATNIISLRFIPGLMETTSPKGQT
uniref:PHD-type domain-containing protein n=1 Tax=Glossina brevipalpis TaxID=37001 RepID=A0A1A9WHF0_9MUSC